MNFTDKLQAASAQISRAYEVFTDDAFRQAITDACGGRMPELDELRKRGQIVVDHNGGRHLLWDHPALHIGDTPDMTKSIVSVPPPRIFNPIR